MNLNTFLFHHICHIAAAGKLNLYLLCPTNGTAGEHSFCEFFHDECVFKLDNDSCVESARLKLFSLRFFVN